MDRSTHEDLKSRLLDAALPHVAFEGWSEETFRAACRETGIEPAAARVLFPRGGVDLALAYHERGDAEMLRRIALEDLPTLRLRDRIASAIRFRLDATPDREAVRRGSALFALPPYVSDGARALWQTADRIWTALGDEARDINWYTKRATLAAIYSATLLYWLGDDSEGKERTWEFRDARVDDAVNFPRLRARFTSNPLMKLILAGPNRLAAQVHAPSREQGLPGHLSRNGAAR